MDTIDMVKTVHEHSTPMVAASYSPITSSTGLLITPPPMPVRAPAVVAIHTTTK